MKKKLLALLITAAMTVPTGLTAIADESEPIKDLVTYVTDTSLLEPNVMLKNANGTSSAITGNYIEGFLEMNEKGQLVGALADEWGSEDGSLTWTFHLRDDLVWVNSDGEVMADLTSEDFVVALEMVMNYWKNEAVNISMPSEIIVGAADYYEYTKELPEAEGMGLDTTKFREMVGIETPDEHTVTYKCIQSTTYFESLAASACLFPISPALIEQLGVENIKGASGDEIWYNGTYVVSEYTEGNSLILEPNPEYWDQDCTRFDSVTYLVVDDDTIAYQMYQNGEIDKINLPASTLKVIAEDEGHEYHDQLVETRMGKTAFSIHFNYQKYNEDGTLDEQWNTAIANEAFRKAFYYSIDWTPFFETVNFITPLSCELNTYTIPGLLYFSDGTDYVEKVKELTGVKENGEVPARYNAELGAQYKAQAMEELSAQGVTFPIEMVYHVKAGDQGSEDQGTIIKQLLTSSLGEDFVTVELDSYVNSWVSETITPQLQCFAINGWGADYGDIKNFLGQETTGNDTAMYATGWSNSNNITDETLKGLYDEYTAMVEEADKIVDNMDERYEAFAKAEAFMLDHAMVMPLYAKVNWQLTHINDYTTPYSMYGVLGSKWKNVETSVEPYTTEQYEAIKEAYFAE